MILLQGGVINTVITPPTVGLFRRVKKMNPRELYYNIMKAAEQAYPNHQEWVLEDMTLGQFLEVLDDMITEGEVIQ